MKKHLRHLLEQRNLAETVELAGRKRRVLGLLLSLTYDRDPLICWRAIEAMGAATEHLAESDPDCVRDLLRRLYWLLSEESGGICWRGPEAMAEIVRRTPGAFGDYIPIVASLLLEMAEEDLDHFRSGVLWAIGRLAPVTDKELDAVLPAIQDCLDHSDPQVRGMAAWCLGQCGQGGRLAENAELLADEGSAVLYEDGTLVPFRVGELARQAAQGPAGSRSGSSDPDESDSDYSEYRRVER